MKSLLTRQQQPSLRHFRSFSVPHPSDPSLPCCFGMSLRRVSCLFSNFNANNFVFFRLPLWQLLPRLPRLPSRLPSCLPGTAATTPVGKGVSYVIIRATSSCRCYAPCPALFSRCFFPLPFVFCRVYLLSIFVSLSRCTPALIHVPFAPLPLFAAVPGREWIIA